MPTQHYNFTFAFPVHVQVTNEEVNAFRQFVGDQNAQWADVGSAKAHHQLTINLTSALAADIINDAREVGFDLATEMDRNCVQCPAFTDDTWLNFLRERIRLLEGNSMSTPKDPELFTIPENDYGIEEGPVHYSRLVDLLRVYKDHPDAIQFIADMMEE
jgi:hypothetical protein